MVFVALSASHIHLISDSKHGFKNIPFLELGEARLLVKELEAAIATLTQTQPTKASLQYLTKS